MHSKNAKYAHDRLNTYQPKTADVRSVQQYKNIIISMYTNQWRIAMNQNNPNIYKEHFDY